MKKIMIALCLSSLTSTYAGAADALKVAPPPQKTLSSQSGRFIFGQISDFRSDQYMLDTQTGRLWTIALKKPKNPDGTDASGEGYRVLDPIPYTDISGNLSLEPK